MGKNWLFNSAAKSARPATGEQGAWPGSHIRAAHEPHMKRQQG